MIKPEIEDRLPETDEDGVNANLAVIAAADEIKLATRVALNTIGAACETLTCLESLAETGDREVERTVIETLWTIRASWQQMRALMGAKS